MSLLLLFRPLEDATPPPTGTTPFRTLLGVGLTLVIPLLPFIL